MKNLLFLFITILFFSCQEKKIDLTGHWHITKHNGSDRSFGLYKTLDFENDSIVYLGRYLNGNGGIMGFVNHQKKNNGI